jgi:hypothetical protein
MRRERGRETFGVVAAQWLASRHDLKPRTRPDTRNLLNAKTKSNHADLSITATFGHHPVNQITRADRARGDE